MNDPLGTDRAVMQAPVDGGSSVALVAAVCAAGGLGTIAGSWMSPGTLAAHVGDLRRVVDRPFAVNLVLDFPQAERAELCAELRVPVVTLSWGVDPALVARLRAGGCRVLVQVGSVAAGRAAAAAGADGVIAQGLEAGGHVESTTGLLVLVRGLARSIGLPIVAAGGIADAETAAAAVAAGASAVSVGTRFVASVESDASDLWKSLLVGASAEDTVLTGLFDVGWPDAAHRVLRNSTYRDWEAAGSPPAGLRPGEGEVLARDDGRDVVRYSDSPPRAVTEGDLEALCLYAGQGVELIDAVLPAADIVERIAVGLRGS